MYIRKKYRVRDMLKWTRREIRFFVVFASIVAILHDVLGLTWLQLPWTPIAMVGTAVAFLVGFQSNAAYGRIWEARKIWGGIVNDSRSFAIMVMDMITNEYASEAMTEEEMYSHKKTIIYRHIAWMTALRYAMRQRKPWETNREIKANKEWQERLYIPELKFELEDELKKVLPENELKHVTGRTNKPAAIMAFQSHHLRTLKERGIIWEFSFLELEGKLSALIDHQGKSERIKNFPYPRQFATIGYDFVNLFIMILPFGIIPEFAKIGERFLADYPLIADSFIWLGIPFSVIVSWIFNTMLRIGTTGENPFEGSPNDVPISGISRGIEIDIREILGEPRENIPDPFPIELEAQM